MNSQVRDRNSRLVGRGLFVGAISLGVLVFLSGCGVASQESEGDVGVVASTTQVGDFVRSVGGGAIEEHQILRSNSDPHDYEPRPEDVRETAGAELVFMSGDDLDGWVEDVVSESGGDPTVVNLAENLPDKLPGEGHEHADEEHSDEQHSDEAHAEEPGHAHDSEYDPHWWHDPRNVEAAVVEIRDTLIEADPENEETYRENAREYIGQVRRLDSEIEACISEVPQGDRKLVTDHDAFGYFTNRYDIEVVGAVIPSQTTQAQPSAQDTAELIDLIERENVRAVFPESSINPRLAQRIASETGATAEYTLYGDTLGPEGSDGDTYLKMEAANANAMVRGFTGGNETCDISVAN